MTHLVKLIDTKQNDLDNELDKQRKSIDKCDNEIDNQQKSIDKILKWIDTVSNKPSTIVTSNNQSYDTSTNNDKKINIIITRADDYNTQDRNSQSFTVSNDIKIYPFLTDILSPENSALLDPEISHLIMRVSPVKTTVLNIAVAYHEFENYIFKPYGF